MLLFPSNWGRRHRKNCCLRSLIRRTFVRLCYTHYYKVLILMTVRDCLDVILPFAEWRSAPVGNHAIELAVLALRAGGNACLAVYHGDKPARGLL